MSQQINLYEARLRPRHDLLTGRNVGVSLGVLLTLVVGLSLYARHKADQATAEFANVQNEVRGAQERMTVLSKSVSERKISPALQGELDAAKAMLAARKEVMDYLDSGRLGSNSGFSGIMLGFARVAQSDLWLTGFSISQGGKELEIRGSMLDSTKLPGYVQRLSAESAFHGRRFAALDIRRVDPAEAKNEAGSAADRTQGSAAPGSLPPRIEFVLRSEKVGESDSTDGKKK